jgi:hypothetical protein
MSKPAAILQIEKELSDRKAAEKAKRDAELKRITDEHDARMKKEAEERKWQIEAEDRRREEQFEAELEADARGLFYEGNPGAPESLWKSVREEFRGLVLRRRAEAAARDNSHSIYRW